MPKVQVESTHHSLVLYWPVINQVIRSAAILYNNSFALKTYKCGLHPQMWIDVGEHYNYIYNI